MTDIPGNTSTETSFSAAPALLKLEGASDWAADLDTITQALIHAQAQLWEYWELHNPFGRAAARIDSWRLLDICEAPQLLAAVCKQLGPDVILFDSQIWPNPVLGPDRDHEWHCDDLFFPLSRGAGLVVRLRLGIGSPLEYDFQVRGTKQEDPARSRIRLAAAGDLILHRSDVRYRRLAVPGEHGLEYVIRYFPASARYIRSPDNPRQRELMERFPWVNYCTMPLWLVSGIDRADNDFVTGFRTRVGRWTEARIVGS